MTVENIDIAGHDPYLIYHMLHREVSFEPLKGRKMRSGIVERVVRDIFKNQVELTLSGQLFRFDEPVAIVKIDELDQGSVVFVYGDLGPELSDEELFQKMHDGTEFYGENVDDVISRTKRKQFKTVQFLLGEKQRRRKTWRMKQTD